MSMVSSTSPILSLFTAFDDDAESVFEDAITAIEREDELIDKCEQIMPPRMEHFENETMLSCFTECILPLSLAGCGQLATGLFLNYVSRKSFFTQIPVAFALITPLLNLKGNLEMNFASRIATYCHTGDIKTNNDLMNLGCINHGLSQSQTISVSALITIFCLLLNFDMPMNNMMILMSSVISTASVASFTIETFLIGVIIVARKLNINPDNVATPIAATFGDISTLFFYVILGFLFIQSCPYKFCYLSLAAVLVSLTLIPFYIRLAAAHPSTQRALYAGWMPLFIATIISSGGGYVLKTAHERFRGYALLQPVIVGLVGSMCGIQASRLSSDLHVWHKRNELAPGTYPRGSLLSTFNPISTFFHEGIQSKVALMMIFVAMPTQLFFAIILLKVGGSGDVVCLSFCIGYLLCVFALITLFMYLCQLFVHLSWRFDHDPDYGVIPLLTAFCDFIGSTLLMIVFVVLDAFGFIAAGRTHETPFSTIVTLMMTTTDVPS